MLELLRMWLYWAWFGLRVGWWKMRHSAVDRAFLLIRQGVFYDLELAHRIYSGKLGNIFAYSDNGIAYDYHDSKTKSELVRTGRDPFEVWEDERLLFMVEDEVICVPVQGTGVAMEADALSNFNRGDAIKQISDSFRQGGQGLNWGSLKWFLVIGAVIIIAFVVYKFILHGHLPGAAVTPTPTPLPEPTPTPAGPIYSWAYWLIMNL